MMTILFNIYVMIYTYISSDLLQDVCDNINTRHHIGDLVYLQYTVVYICSNML